MFGFLPGNLFTHHMGQSSSGLSPRLWARVTGAMSTGDGSKRLILAGDDFLTPKSTNSYTETLSEMSYTSYIDTGNTIVGLADEKGGVIALTTDATDNDEVWLASGDATSVLGAISDAAGAAHLTAFECRVKKSSIADNGVAIFCGLAEEGLAVADTKVDNTGLMGDKDFIGFDSVHADGDAINFVYHKAGDTNNGGTIKIAAAHVPVADTFVKLGFLYDPDSAPAKRIRIFVDNVESATSVSAADIASTTTGALFPDGEELCALFGMKNGGGAAAEFAADWWAFAQLIT